MKIVIIVFSLLTLIACSHKANLINPCVQSSDFNQGNQLFNAKCVSCHRPYLIKEYKQHQWDSILPIMFEKAQCNSFERFYIQYFVDCNLGKKLD